MSVKILIAYATKSGSTAEIAQAIGQGLSNYGTQVDVIPVKRVYGLSEYDAVIIGAPMIMGWHEDAVKFLTQHQPALSQVPVAYFMVGLSLTKTGDDQVDGIPIFLDPIYPKPPKKEGKLSFKEEYATVSNYLNPILNKAPQIRPVSVGFFKGKLDTARLDLMSRGFVSMVIGAHSGDYRNWEAMRAWADSLGPILIGEKKCSAFIYNRIAA